MGRKEVTFDNPPNIEEAKLLKQKRKRLKKEKRTLQRQQKKEQLKIQDETITSSTQETTRDSSSIKTEVKTENSTAYDALWQNYIPMPTLLIRQHEWYMERPFERETPTVLVNLSVRKKIKDFAAEIYKNELAQFEKFEENSRDRDMRLRQQILSHGATKDRLTAHVLQLSEYPVQSLSHLSKLCDFISVNKESQLKEMSKSLKDLFDASLLPKGLVARQFEDHDFHKIILPLAHSDRQRAYTILLLWYYEDQLRLLYTRIISALKQVVSAGTSSIKLTGVQLLLGLLGNHPNQETEIVLQVLINKLGDLDKTVAYAVVYGLRNLLIRRPGLKIPLVDICGEFLFRPNQRKNTLYNCMQLLKDVFFTKDDVALVQKMIKLYFGFFKACTKTGEVDGKLMSVILRGLNRALPYAINAKGREASNFLEEQFDMLYKMVHLVQFNISVQILQLMYQVLVNIEPNASLPERFERVMYERLLCPELGRSSVVGAFLNLVFKTMARMTCPSTLKAFVKRLLQVSFYQPSHLAIALVFVLSESSVDNKLMRSVIEEVALERSLGPGGSNERRKLDVSKSEDDSRETEDSLSQDNSNSVNSEVNGEATKSIDAEESKKSKKKKNKKGKANNSDKQPEPMLVSNVSFGESETPPPPAGEERLTSWLCSDETRAPGSQEEKLTTYDAFHRNPKYCGTHYTKVWELRNAMNHFHPSMTAFTKSLVEQEHTKYRGDPLIDYALIKFLDRFVNKTPKKIVQGKQTGGATALGAKSVYSGSKYRSMCVTSDYFRNLDENRVPEDAKFFHKYFTSYSLAASRPQKPEQDDECDDVDDAEFERYLQSAAGQKNVPQNPYTHEDELDDQWDFAANAKSIGRADKENDSDLDSVDEDNEDGEFAENGETFYGEEEMGDENMDDENMDDEDIEELENDSEADFGEDFDDLDTAEDHGHMYLDDEEMEEKPVQNRKKIEQKLKAVADKNKKAKRELVKKEKEKQINKAKNDVKLRNRTASDFDGLDARNTLKKSKQDASQRKKRQRDSADEENFSDWGSDGGDDDDEGFGGKPGKMKKLDDLVFGKKKDRSARSLDAMMVDADEFSEMLQRNENRPPAITSSDFVNTADISQNQLRWERAHASDRLGKSKGRNFGQPRPAGGRFQGPRSGNAAGGRFQGPRSGKAASSRFQGTRPGKAGGGAQRKGGKTNSRFNRK